MEVKKTIQRIRTLGNKFLFAPSSSRTKIFFIKLLEREITFFCNPAVFNNTFFQEFKNRRMSNYNFLNMINL